MFPLKIIALIFSISALLISTASLAKSVDAQIVNPDSLKWVEVSDLPPGATVAILSGNPEKKQPFVVRIKLPANYFIPAHSHPVNEYDTVLSGTLYVGMGNKKDLTHGQAVATGGFVMIPAKLEHYTWTKEETILQIGGIGPWGMLYSKATS